MIKEAIDYLLNKVSYEIKGINGVTYHITNAGFKRFERPTVDSFQVSTLTGLVDYINTQVDEYSTEKMILQVVNEKTVTLMSALKDQERDHYIVATANVPRISFDNFIAVEQFNIMLQACFESTQDLDAILRIVGNIKEENIKNTADDGITQQVVAKSGIARVEEVAVPNPVLLVPHRTFVEVAQPASKFIFRLQNGPRGALFEADAGAWKNTAMQSIKKYLQENIKVPNIEILA